MEPSRVIRILECVANGIDPHNGQKLEGVFATPDVIRALFTAANIIKRIPDERESRRGKLVGAGTRWATEEDVSLTTEYDEGMSISEIAAKHMRTETAITLRLIKLGRLPAPHVGAVTLPKSSPPIFVPQAGSRSG